MQSLTLKRTLFLAAHPYPDCDCQAMALAKSDHRETIAQNDREMDAMLKVSLGSICLLVRITSNLTQRRL